MPDELLCFITNLKELHSCHEKVSLDVSLEQLKGEGANLVSRSCTPEMHTSSSIFHRYHNLWWAQNLDIIMMVFILKSSSSKHMHTRTPLEENANAQCYCVPSLVWDISNANLNEVRQHRKDASVTLKIFFSLDENEHAEGRWRYREQLTSFATISSSSTKYCLQHSENSPQHNVLVFQCSLILKRLSHGCREFIFTSKL